MNKSKSPSDITRRTRLGAVGKTAVGALAMPSLLRASALADIAAPTGQVATDTAAPMNGVAGVDRVVVLPGKTYLRG